MAVKVALDECLSIRDGRLSIEECHAHELARRFGTPQRGAPDRHRHPTMIARR